MCDECPRKIPDELDAEKLWDDLPNHLDDDMPAADPRRPIIDPAHALRFMLAGNAIVTLASKKTGKRYTYKVRASEDGRVHFVALLTGPQNEDDFAYLGYIRRGVYFYGNKSRVGRDAPSAKAFDWTFKALAQNMMPAQLEVWHEGRCGRCGRTLTVPSSIASGFGPECITKIGGDHGEV